MYKLLGITALTLSLGAQSLEAAEKWRYFSITSPNQGIGEIVKESFDNIKARTNGDLEIEYVSFAETPYKATDALQLIKDDLVEMVEFLTVYVANTYPLLTAPTLPFLAPTNLTVTELAHLADKAWAVEPVANAKKALLDEFNAQPVAIFYNAPTNVWVTTPLDPITNFDGRRIRVYDPETSAVIASMGGTPTAMTAPETYSALQRGGLDGVLSSPVAVLGLNWHEMVETGYILNVGVIPNDLLASKTKIDSLDPSTREIFLDEMQKLTTRLKQEIEPLTQKYYVELEAAGVTLIKPSDADYQAMREIVRQQVWPDWANRRGEGTQEALDAILEAIN